MSGDARGAEATNERGRWLLAEGELDAAEQAFQEAIVRDPGSFQAWFNLGLVHKRRMSWDEMRRCNQRSAELGRGGERDPVWWNLGIAATALRDWTTARRAWTAYGVKLPDGTGPIDGDFGRACVRISPNTTPEVVWVRRLDPARGRILSGPLPAGRASGRGLDAQRRDALQAVQRGHTRPDPPSRLGGRMGGRSRVRNRGVIRACGSAARGVGRGVSIDALRVPRRAWRLG